MNTGICTFWVCGWVNSKFSSVMLRAAMFVLETTRIPNCQPMMLNFGALEVASPTFPILSPSDPTLKIPCLEFPFISKVPVPVTPELSVKLVTMA